MELKVWVEGIQRVVCGVTESTTCQDIVYALAHATGQTGRFTLVERWRHNERLLPPHEHPLKVLTKWGEYASNVQFILRRSEKKTSTSKNTGNTSQSDSNTSGGNKRQHDTPQIVAPTSPPSTPIGASNKELRKSFTFSGSHGSSSSEQSTPNTIVSAKVDATEIRTGPPNTKLNRPDIPKGIIKGIQQNPMAEQAHSPVKAKTDRPRQPPSYDEAVSRSSRHTSHLTQPPQAPPSRTETDSPTSKRRHLVRVTESSAKEEKSDDSSFNTSWDNMPQDSNKNSARVKPRKNLIGQFEKEETTVPVFESGKEAKGDDSSLNQDPQLRDLVRLVNLQREKLGSQNLELTQYDSEIGYWETKLQEREERLRGLEEDLHLLERTNREHEEELQQLELHQPTLIEAIDKGRQDDRVLRSKLSLLRAQVANCETEVLQCRQKMRHILEEIAEERKRNNVEREHREHLIQKQLRELEDQIFSHKTEAEKQKQLLAKLEEELEEFDSQVKNKSCGADKLTEELREENLQSLSLATAQDMKSLADGNFHNRSGSTRRIMGSPRQLENAVPTSKNPHGVWV